MKLGHKGNQLSLIILRKHDENLRLKAVYPVFAIHNSLLLPQGNNFKYLNICFLTSVRTELSHNINTHSRGPHTMAIVHVHGAGCGDTRESAIKHGIPAHSSALASNAVIF